MNISLIKGIENAEFPGEFTIVNCQGYGAAHGLTGTIKQMTEKIEREYRKITRHRLIVNRCTGEEGRNLKVLAIYVRANLAEDCRQINVAGFRSGSTAWRSAIRQTVQNTVSDHLEKLKALSERQFNEKVNSWS